MKKRSCYFFMAFALVTILILVLGINVEAYKDASGEGKIPFASSKSDRTLLKEVWMTQKENNTLLKEIKAMLESEGR